MTSSRVLVISAVALVTAGWLQADTLPVDPLIKFTTGGGGSTHIVCNTSGCETDLSPLIDAGGQANLDIFNDTGKNIAAMTFVIPTTNFHQDFFASTNAFENTAIFADEGPPLPTITVQFSGLGNTSSGPAFLASDPEAPSGAAGFTPGGLVKLFVVFGNAPAGSTFSGFANGQEGTLSLTVPEPGMFWLLLSGGLALLLARRKLLKA
jgi:hypothetical protein